MKSSNYIITLMILLLSGMSYLVSQSLFAGVIIGILSFVLIRFYLFAILKIGNVKFLIMFLNTLKFGFVIFMLFVFIRYLKLDALQIAIGYSLVFLLMITELFIRKPKEL